jgi:hypothetical protein
MMYAIVAKVVMPARSSVRKAVPRISFCCRNINASFSPKQEKGGWLTYMATALQAEHASEGRLSDGFIDELSIVTTKGHFGEGLCLRKASAGQEKWNVFIRGKKHTRVVQLGRYIHTTS